MAYDEPPEDNDLGQDAVPLTELTLDRFGPDDYTQPPVRYEVCAVCGFIYGRNEMVKYQNKWYCTPQSCNRDIVGIRLKENKEANFKNKGLANRFYTRGQ